MTPRSIIAAESWWESRGRSVPEAGTWRWNLMLRTWQRFAFWGMR